MNDKLRLLVQVGLPVLGVLYFMIAEIAELSHTDLVLGGFLLAVALVGGWLYLTSRSDAQYDGEMDVQKVGEKTVFQMAFSDEEQLEHLADMKEVRFKVNRLDE